MLKGWKNRLSGADGFKSVLEGWKGNGEGGKKLNTRRVEKACSRVEKRGWQEAKSKEG